MGMQNELKPQKQVETQAFTEISSKRKFLKAVSVVGPAGFEPTTFTRKQCFNAVPTGFSNRSRTSSSQTVLVRKPVSFLLEPVVIPV